MASGVDKNVKFNIYQEHVGNTLETRYVYVGYAWCTSDARRCTSLKIGARFVRVWTQNYFKREARRAPGVFHLRFEYVPHALQAR